MTERQPAATEGLRISDLVPLRRMLGSDSVVIRVHPDGSFIPYEQMPSLFFERTIRRMFAADVADRFNDACTQAVERREAVSFVPDPAVNRAVLINPILAETGDDCRFLVCWVRRAEAADAPNGFKWPDLALADVVTRFRSCSTIASTVVEAAPWWAPRDDTLIDLWPHHTHVSAMGLGHAVMEALITDAAEAAAACGGGPAVRIEVPSADMLAGLVPVFHGAVRASRLEPQRVIVAIDVGLAVDPDLLPIIVHLRTIGIQIDIVGLDALTSTLHLISDTTSYQPPAHVPELIETGPWVGSFSEAVSHR